MSLCSCHLTFISMLLNEQSCLSAPSYIKIVFICLSASVSKTTYNIARILPQRLALFSETSVTWGPIALYRTETTTTKVKLSLATAWISLWQLWLAPHSFAFPLAQSSWCLGVFTPQLSLGSQQVIQRHTMISLSSSLFIFPKTRNRVNSLFNVLIRFSI